MGEMHEITLLFVLICLFIDVLSQEWDQCGTQYWCSQTYCDGKYYSLTSDNLFDYSRQSCIDRVCSCENISGFNKYCYPNVFGCNVCWGKNVSNIANEHKSAYYSCLNNEYSNGNYEIRVIGVKVASNYLTDKINVELVYCGSLNITESKPIKLILLSYEAVKWNVYTSDEFVLNELEFEGIYSVSSQYRYVRSSISISSNLGNIKTNNSYSIVTGYGNDGQTTYYGRGRTARFLLESPAKYGDFVYTFIGRYSMENISICVGRDNDIGNISYNIGLKQQYTPSPTPVTPSPTVNPRYKHLSEAAQITTFVLIIIVSIMIVIILKMFVCKRNNNAPFDQNIAVQA